VFIGVNRWLRNVYPGWRFAVASLSEVLNLEEGFPTAEEALGKLVSGLRSAKSRGVVFVKVIHGWGSNGRGGQIKRKVKAELPELGKQGLLREWVLGTDWKVTDPTYLQWYSKYPELKNDRDLNRNNAGITMIKIR
jgi:hypothetical protein